MKKKIIITADDFGINKFSNDAIVELLSFGILKSTCLITNMDGFYDAIDKIKMNNDIDIGLHLNVVEGKSLVFKTRSYLTNDFGEFSNSFLSLLIKSYDDRFLEQLEEEFCAQIERAIKNGVKISYINSHVHTHSIPNIFKLVLKLCKKYNIKAIRTQNEPFYCVKNFKKHFKMSYFINIIKNILLNYFTYINKKTLKNTDVKTNDEFLGVLYTGNMDKNTILEGIKKIKNNSEIILHPTLDVSKSLNYGEYKALSDKTLLDELNKLDLELINWQEYTFMS